MRLIALDLEPVGNFRTDHSRNAGLYRALESMPGIEIVDAVYPKLPAVQRRMIQLAYVRRGRERWRQRSGLSTVAFDTRTRLVERELSARAGAYDAVLQVGCVYAPGSLARGRRFVLYLDSNLLLNHRQWQASVPLGPLARRGWVRREREVYARAQHIFTMSNWARASMIEDYGIEPGRVSTVGAGTNLVSSELPPRESDRPVALFVGLEFGRKGGPQLLAAWRQVADHVPGAELWLVGTRGQPRSEGSVRWFGRVGAEELRSLYARASVFVLPSMYDMFPHVLREALGSGLPCVTTTAGAISEIVRDGVDSLLVPPGDVDALAATLVEMLSDLERARKMGLAGRDRVLTEASWAAVAGRMMPQLTESGPHRSDPAARSPAADGCDDSGRATT